MIFRLVYGFVILSLLAALTFTEGYFRGYDDGYAEAMSNTLLELDSPEIFFERILEQMRSHK